MNIQTFTFNHFDVNCYLLIDEESSQCAIVDPAAEASYEEVQLTQYIATKHLTPTHILLTHAHVDHIAGLRQICDLYHLPVSLHPDGKTLLRQAELYGSMMGFDVSSMQDLPTADIYGGQSIMIGSSVIECRYVPGHCPGSICFVIPSNKTVITGDALFSGSIGRTDLPGGNYRLLIDSINSQLLTLPDDYKVLPGHGGSSTIGYEKQYNGFLI